MIRLPAMVPAQEQAWLALLDLAERLPDHWCIVGGQMVHLLCAERGAQPTRPTTDLDTVLDVRAAPSIHADFTRALSALGFASDEVTQSGHQIRWRRGGARIDVLIPRFLGPLAENRPGAGGSPALPTPGAQRVLERAETVEVGIGPRRGRVRRPTLVGAVIAKSAAATVYMDLARRRHLEDLIVLSTLLSRSDRMDDLDLLSYRRVASALRACAAAPGMVAAAEGGRGGLVRLSRLLAGSAHSVVHGGSEPPPVVIHHPS